MVGETFLHYKVIETERARSGRPNYGAGGMGVVYKAQGLIQFKRAAILSSNRE